MKRDANVNTTVFVLTILLIIGLPLRSFGQMNPIKPTPKLIMLDKAAAQRIQILNGPPGTVTMRSGFMVLAPSKSVGKHSTKENEEAIVVMAGKGEFKIIEGSTFEMHPYCIIYCPPNTEHDVTNTGTDTLRYVYIVARAKE